MTRRISETLDLRRLDGGDQICCGHCGLGLAAAEQSWKQKVVVSTVPVRRLPGASSAVHASVVFRQFSCPGCGSLLDSETALTGDPYLEDVILA